MKQTIRLIILSLLAATLVAQPTPPSNISVTANSSTGALVAPSSFFTGNQAAIASVVGNAGITGNVTIGASNTLTLSGTVTGTPVGGTLNLSGLTLNIGSPTATTIKANNSAGLTFQNSGGSNVLLLGPGPGTGITFYGGITGASIDLGSNTLTGTSAQLATAISDETGTGSLVFANGPTITLGNATGLPLATGVTGTLAVGNGGTGLTSPGTSGNVLTSNGTAWVSSAPPATGVTSVTGTANQITVTGTTTPTLSIPSAFIFPGNATITSTNTLKFGATAAATIGVNADTTAGNVVFTPSSTGAFTFGGGSVVQGSNASTGLTLESTAKYQMNFRFLGVDSWYMNNSIFRPTSDNALALGEAGNRLSAVISTTFGIATYFSDSAARSVTYGGIASSGTNLAGGKVIIQPGLGTGNATPAYVSIYAATAQASGTTSHTSAEVFRVTNSGFGYATGAGAGGTVTQATSRTTGVTLNLPTGAITLVSAAGSATWQTFTLTNSAIASTDMVIWNQVSGSDKYMIHTTNVSSGSCQVTFATTGGTTTEQPVFRFAIVKSSSN